VQLILADSSSKKRLSLEESVVLDLIFLQYAVVLFSPTPQMKNIASAAALFSLARLACTSYSF